ncbi:DEAD/DEAH box helicase [Actinomadura rupiterrae]|uniref:DEAD/DEAH box helicase n=1 Tax=Actinomadura rupiterrae TaxID=559627 RepID=UPI0020A2D34E|nr:DEAD/DEAH box helicase [Actinomadura rupiterrae]MCP2342159.1 non-specific serine/threonine protein kinase [Actinomadura rupiterrae]
MLPSHAGAPFRSPELTGPYGKDLPTAHPRGAVARSQWRVPALLFEPSDAAQLLGELHAPRRPYLATGSVTDDELDIPYGASLRWLTNVHDLAWRLVGQGQILPTLVTADDVGHYARWRPAPDAVRRQEIADLAATTPPICLAEPTGGRPGRHAAELTAGLLEVLVDCEARAILQDRPALLGGGRPAGTAAERWLKALASKDGRIAPRDATDSPDASDAAEPSDAAEMRALQAGLAAWHMSDTPEDERLRLGFRLAEPLGEGPDHDDRWSLEPLVQAADEPSLLVTASELWSRGPALAALQRKVDEPQELFLALLERACEIRPELRRLLRAPRPGAVTLNRAETLTFLNETAPVLTAAGFEVYLPAWWQRPARVGLALTTRSARPDVVQGPSLIDKKSIVNFEWQVAIGELALDEQELADLVAAKKPLIRLRGRWVRVDPARLAAAADFVAREATGTMPARRVVRTALDPEASAGGLPVTQVLADGRLGDLLNGGQELDEVVLPEWFGTTLRPYQERGVAWLSLLSQLGLGAVLADDMGLGKGVQVLGLVAAEHRQQNGPTLVICPLSLVDNWRREIERFTPALRVYVHHGVDRRSGDALRQAVTSSDIVITTYAVVRLDVEALRRIDWLRIVADEAQHIKNRNSEQARAVRALPAEQRIALTGTPVENRLSELHSILDFANPGLFGSSARFKEHYSLPIEQTGSQRAAAALRRHTRPLILRRLKTDPAIIQDLPNKRETTLTCGLTAEQATLYRGVVADMLDAARRRDGIERRGIVLASLSKLKQICNHPAQFLKEGTGAGFARRSGKVARLEEFLEATLAKGDKTLCFTQFAEFGTLLKAHLTERLGEEVLFLHGGLARRAREQMVARFQDPDGPRVFVLSLKAGGTGLNLTAANQVVHLDRWWNPAVEEQATDRAFRIGQRRDVQVSKLVCAGTVEERIETMIETKRALAETAVGTGEDWLADLSLDALHELVALPADAGREQVTA